MFVFLGVKPLALPDDNDDGSDGQTENKQYQACHKTDDDVAEDESHHCTADGCRRPIDVTALKSEELQRTLQSLEKRIVVITLSTACLCHDCLNEKQNDDLLLTSDAEEQRQGLGCRDEEDTGSHNHHDLLLEILLIVCNVLIFNIYCVSEMEKETKWKQQNQETPK